MGGDENAVASGHRRRASSAGRAADKTEVARRLAERIAEALPRMTA